VETSEIRSHATYLLEKADEALKEGNVEEAKAKMGEAEKAIQDADAKDEAQAELDRMKGDFGKPINTVPVASSDLATYDPDDNGAELKASYKPASWVKGLPAVAQPIWVQEKMGIREKEQAEFQRDTFTKWMMSPSQEIFFKNATPDEIKAMQEDKILCPLS
tara:strand:+ start:246 stop:731 length:486 start_codon:yes stop_codon:yes gene_type:complete